MNSELSFDYRITDSVRPNTTALWKAIAVTVICAAFAILLLISAKDVYRVFPDPALLMDPPVVAADQQYATAAPVERMGN